MDIFCIKNYGYKWTIENNIFFKGYFILNKTLYRDLSAVNYLTSLNNYNDFIKTIKSLYGCFAIIIKKEQEVWSAVDRARSIPIYFSTDGCIVSDCAEKIRLELNINIDDVSIKNLSSLLYTQFTILNNTVYDKIKQLTLGQTLLIKNNSIKYEYYYRHVMNVKEIERSKAFNLLENKLSDVFDRIITAINNRSVLLSLSGGYDSRLVACMLKEKGVTDVTCFTYGSSSSYEIEISKKTAQNLGYKWYCITYSNDDVKSIFTDENEPFFAMNNTHDYIIYLQNYIALKKLKEQNIININSVIITGLCGDKPSGVSILPQNRYSNIPLTYKGLASSYINNLFYQHKINNNILNLYKEEIEDDVKKCDIKLDSIQNYVALKECMETAGVEARCFLQANRTHEFFGFEWLLPLWDNDYLDFWYSLPLEYKIYQNLYEDYLINNLFLKYNVAIKKIKAKRPADKIKRKRSETEIKIKYFLIGILTRISFATTIPLRRKIADQNNFSPATVLLYKKINDKKIINYKRVNFTHLLNIYLLEKRYGSTILNKIKQGK